MGGVNGPLTSSMIAAGRCFVQPSFKIQAILRAVLRDEMIAWCKKNSHASSSGSSTGSSSTSTGTATTSTDQASTNYDTNVGTPSTTSSSGTATQPTGQSQA